MKNRCLTILMAGIFFLSGSSFAASSSEDGTKIGDMGKYTECYLLSYYASNILMMRYHNLSRFEIEDAISEEVTNLPDNREANNLNQLVLSKSGRYVDEVFEMAPESDDDKITSMTENYKDKVLNECLTGVKKSG